jgi:hypothetical protein
MDMRNTPIVHSPVLAGLSSFSVLRENPPTLANGGFLRYRYDNR